MPSFLLKNIPRHFWKRVKTQAHLDDIRLNKLAIKLFSQYVNDREAVREKAK